MIKRIVLVALLLVVSIFFFVVAFFAFAPEDRVYGVKHWYKLKQNDPISHCLEHYKSDFLAPESVRFVEGSVTKDINDEFFEMRLSGLTRGGGRSHTYVTCVGKYGRQSLYVNNKKLDFAREFNQTLRSLSERNAEIARDLKQRELEKGRY